MSILVLDVGTTSMRGILYDARGEKLAVVQVPNHVEFLTDGIVKEKSADWENNTAAIIRGILDQISGSTEEIEAVAITSQRSSIIPVDRDGKPLMDTIMWQDVRNREICKRIEKENPVIFEKTGSLVNTVFSGSKMTWVREERPEIYERVYKFVNIPEYMNFLMCGVYVSDYTYASRSGLMNLREKAWDEELLRLYHVDEEKLCVLQESGSIVGRTTQEFEKKTGLRSGTPVIHAGGDQQCAAIGQGVIKAGNTEIVLGTGGFLMAVCDEVPENLSDDVICNAFSVAGKYMIEANVLACSAAYDWLGHQLFGMEQIDYAFLERELEAFPQVTDCLVIPYIKGRGVPDWNAGAKAVFADVTLATTRTELFKSFLESLFLEFRNHLETFEKYMPLGTIYVSGGMTKSETINQLLADAIGFEIVNRDDKEATARGAWLMALVGLGYYGSVDEAIHSVGDSGAEKHYFPDPEKAERYKKKRLKMNELYQKMEM